MGSLQNPIHAQKLNYICCLHTCCWQCQKILTTYTGCSDVMVARSTLAHKLGKISPQHTSMEDRWTIILLIV